jgi:hypothetical protein
VIQQDFGFKDYRIFLMSYLTIPGLKGFSGFQDIGFTFGFSRIWSRFAGFGFFKDQVFLWDIGFGCWILAFPGINRSDEYKPTQLSPGTQERFCLTLFIHELPANS